MIDTSNIVAYYKFSKDVQEIFKNLETDIQTYLNLGEGMIHDDRYYKSIVWVTGEEGIKQYTMNAGVYEKDIAPSKFKWLFKESATLPTINTGMLHKESVEKLCNDILRSFIRVTVGYYLLKMSEADHLQNAVVNALKENAKEKVTLRPIDIS